jgi:uncharacterized protein
MPITVRLQITPEKAFNHELLEAAIAQHANTIAENISGFYIVKQSIDARSKQQIWVNITAEVFINEPFIARKVEHIALQDVQHAKHSCIVIGAGPAGLFAALQLISVGIKPIILERGKDVRARRRDLAVLNKQGIVNPESNYCFGEGGAGTYSDGKLYTRSNKRGSIDSILNIFVQFGADEKILYQSHPHIGTNKLPDIITNIRLAIQQYGGQYFFEEKVTEFIIKNNTITGVKTAAGNSFMANATILATGHSARDIFSLLQTQKILIEAKPFALGVRIEHPQMLIDSSQYHCPLPKNAAVFERPHNLPPASYSMVEQVNGKGVFSFCMCPGGVIAPAATNANELVVNGWSPSKRNNPYANSGMVVSVSKDDALEYFKMLGVKNESFLQSPLLLMEFQKSIEEKCFEAGGGNFVAPAQRLVDFCNNKSSTNLPTCSYVPGVVATNIATILPSFISSSLQKAFIQFGKKLKGYYTNDAILVATESRTSSPVRIPRDANTLQHPQIKGLYPCGEGAGYAGGIISAAMDGEKIAKMVSAFLQ